jgi:gag-polyprotein putative aspartyl protease
VRRIPIFAITALIILADTRVAEADAVPLRAEDGTLVGVAVLINEEIELGFTIDSASSDVSISSDVFSTLVRAGTITDDDMIDTQSYRLADGSEHSTQRFRIRSLRVGTVEIHNVIGSVILGEGDLLLGQSFLSKLKSWAIDNERHMLLLNELPIERPVPGKSAPRIEASARIESMPPGDNVFRNALAYLLTGDDLGKITVVNRARCIVEIRHRIWPNTPDLVSLIYLNNVDRTRSSIQAISDVPRNRVDITLRGESVVDYLARPAFKFGERVFPDAPAHSASEDTITLYTDEVARVRRAWDYIYSHGCRGLKGSF